MTAKARAAVSIIIPVYNGEKYLCACLDSVFSQTLKDIQVICVNDGSTDESLKILEKYKKLFPDMVLISQENGGLSAARNAGLKVANGKYVDFLDCDDMLQQDAMQRLYVRASSDNLDMLFYDGVTVYEDENLRSGYENYVNLYRTKVAVHETVMTGEKLFVKLVEGGSYRSSACMYLLRTDYLREIGVSFFPGIYYEDNVFTMQCLLLAKRCGLENIPYYQRLVRSDSIVTMKKSFQHARSGYICQSLMLAFLFSHQLSADTIRCARQQCNALMYSAISAYASLSIEEKQEAMRKYPEAQLVDDALQTDYLLTASETVKKPRMEKGGEAEANELPDLDEGEYQPESPWISVIIPVYNAEKYLPDTLSDLRRQTLKNFEIIFVDDGSTDDSLAILNCAAEADSRVHVLHQKNQYAGAARNRGMENAKGKYLLFLDADDRFDATLLQSALTCAEKQNAQIVIYHADILRMPEGEYVPAEFLCPCSRLPADVFSGAEGREHIFDVLNPWTKLYRHDYIRNLGICYQTLYSSNDLYFSMIAMACAERIAPLPRVLVHYRTGISGNIQSMKTRYPLDTYEAFLGVKEELVRRQIYDVFQKPFAVKAAESMLRTLDTMKDFAAYRQLYEVLHQGGFETLDLPCVSVADVQHISDGANKLSRCCRIMELDFDHYCLECLTGIEKRQRASPLVRYGYREAVRLRAEVEALRSSHAYRIGSVITKPLHILKMGIKEKIRGGGG